MGIKNNKNNKGNKDDILEVSFVEIHYDENGNEYYKYALSVAPLLTSLPFIYTVLFIACAFIVTWNTFVGFGIGLVLAVTIKPIRKLIVKKLLASGKYYDDGKFGKF